MPFSAYIWIALGGAAGALARYLTERLLKNASLGLQYPVGTFVANLLGAFLLGLILGKWLEAADSNAQRWRLLLGTGFCGSYTTFSTFLFEQLTMLREGKWPTLVGYVGLSLLLGLLAVWLGWLLGRKFS